MYEYIVNIIFTEILTNNRYNNKKKQQDSLPMKKKRFGGTI